MQVEQALKNISEAIRVFKGTADEHQALAASFQVVVKAALPATEEVLVEEKTEDADQ